MTSPAQESVRLSLAGAEAAAARRQAAGTLGYYNVKIGPTAWTFTGGLTLEGNDNIRLEHNGRADVIFRPELRTQMLWPISEKNSLNLSIGGGYSAYLVHPEFDRWFLSPGSELSLDVYAGDFWINLHDRFSVQEDTYADPTVVGSGNYARLQNTLGLNTTWDLNKLVVRAGYDHVNYVALQGNGGGAPDGQSEVLSSSAGFRILPELLAGIEAGGSFIQYSSSGNSGIFFRRATQWNTGVFAEVQVSEHLSFHGSVGYTMFSPESSGTNTSKDFSGVYTQIGLTHRLNEFVTYSLTGGRNISYGFYGGTIDLSSANLGLEWHILQKTSLSTSFLYEHGSQFIIGNETFDRFGPGVQLSRPFTQKSTLSLSYQFYWRESDIPGRNYTANIAALTFAYRF
jgi:Putative beta-barrel porin 2